MLKALAQAKVDYVGSVFNICHEFGCRAFASIVETDAPPTEAGGLRKELEREHRAAVRARAGTRPSAAPFATAAPT